MSISLSVKDTGPAGDYDGDGRFDTAVFRPAMANWFVQRSTAGILVNSFGALQKNSEKEANF